MFWEQESRWDRTVSYLSQKIENVWQFLQEKVEPFIERGVSKAQPVIEKSKEFYKQHKEIVLIVGVASITYLIMRPKVKQEEKSKKKKLPVVKGKLNKSFISDDSVEQFRDEPSTTVRVQSSGKEILKKKHPERKILERIQSSSESEEGGDKIFFEMYENYKQENLN